MGKKTYSYLKDPRALAEIRKHKWIESQKAGREIGFATAALDWIKAHGADWEKFHLMEEQDNALFVERRKYRRFYPNCIVKLVKDGGAFLANLVNVSFFGFFCKSPTPLPINHVIDVILSYGPHKDMSMKCKAVVERVDAIGREEYALYASFDSHGQKEISAKLPIVMKTPY